MWSTETDANPSSLNSETAISVKSSRRLTPQVVTDPHQPRDRHLGEEPGSSAEPPGQSSAAAYFTPHSSSKCSSKPSGPGHSPSHLLRISFAAALLPTT